MSQQLVTTISAVISVIVVLWMAIERWTRDREVNEAVSAGWQARMERDIENLYRQIEIARTTGHRNTEELQKLIGRLEGMSGH